MSWHSRMRGLVLLGGAAFWLTGFGALGQEQTFFASPGAVGLTAAQASRGKAIYDDNCANCHGANLDDGQFGPPQPVRECAVLLHCGEDAAVRAGRAQ